MQGGNRYGSDHLKHGVSAKDACPAGWHTVSDEGWKVMEKYLGMSDADLNVETHGQVSLQIESTKRI